MNPLVTVDRWLLADAPAARLAALRILVGGFAVVYVAVRAPALWALTRRPPTRFEPVGVLWWLDRPPAPVVVGLVLVVTVVLGLAFVAGWHHRVLAPAFAAVLLAITTYHGSWGQLLHFENLFVLHVVVLAFSPAADVWAVGSADRRHGPSLAHGWPVRLMAIITVTTYVIAGIAKLRLTGFDWITGDTLRNHIAYSATRAELFGGIDPPLAGSIIDHTALLPWLAAGSLVLELGAPLALAGRRLRDIVVSALVVMHVAIAALLAVFFPYQGLGFAFAPLFAIERPLAALGRRVGRLRVPAEVG